MRKSEPTDDHLFEDDIDLEDEDDIESGPLVRSVWRLGDLILLPIHLLGWGLFSVRVFLSQWLTSRPAGLFVSGLPAAIALLVTGIVVMSVRPAATTELIRRYRDYTDEAIRNQDLTAATLWLEKIVQLKPDDPEYQFKLAQMAIEDGREATAREIMYRIAPVDGAGYPPAHLWLAKDLLRAGGQLSVEQAESLEHHLQQSLGLDEFQTATHALLGELSLRRGDFGAAIGHFEQIVWERPDLQIALAQAYQREDREFDAKRTAERARDYFRDLVQQDRKNAKALLGWAMAEQILGNYDVAARILEAELATEDPQRFREPLTALYLTRLNEEAAGGPATLVAQLELLNRALTHAPQDPRLLTHLAKLALEDWERTDEALATLKELVARGVAPAVVHLVLGTQILKRGDLEDALTHLELAYGSNAETPVILNNLAWALAHREPPDLERALALIQAAKQLSNHPEILDTIGTILAIMGRDREAIRELELAVRVLPNRRELHARLATCYENLGEQDLARIHRRLAEEDPAERP